MNYGYFETCPTDEHKCLGHILLCTTETCFLLPLFIHSFILLAIHLALPDFFRGYNHNLGCLSGHIRKIMKSITFSLENSLVILFVLV